MTLKVIRSGGFSLKLKSYFSSLTINKIVFDKLLRSAAITIARSMLNSDLESCY